MRFTVRTFFLFILVLFFVNLSSSVTANLSEDHFLYLPSIVAPATSHSLWAATIGGSGTEYGMDVIKISDGNYAVAGRNREQAYPGYIFTIDDAGNVGWQKSHQMGGILSWVTSTADGNIIVAGPSNNYGGTAIVKHSLDGSVIWRQFVDGDDDFYDAALTAGDGLVLAGGLYKGWVVRSDDHGTPIWEKRFNAPGNQTLESIDLDGGGGFIAAGQTTAETGAGGWDGWVVGLDSTGEIAWQKTFGSTDSEYIESIQHTSDGGFVVAGWVWTDTSQDGWVMKVDQNNTVQWSKAYAGDDLDNLLSIEETGDGGYIVSGWSQSFGAGSGEGWVMKLNSLGAIAWQRAYRNSHISAIREVEDGGFIAAGIYSGDVWVLRLDDYGNIPLCEMIEVSNAQERDHPVSANDASIPSVDGTISTGGNFYVADEAYTRTFVCGSDEEMIRCTGSVPLSTTEQ